MDHRGTQIIPVLPDPIPGGSGEMALSPRKGHFRNIWIAYGLCMASVMTLEPDAAAASDASQAA